MRKTYNSGIPVLKQNITDQIKSFRLQKEEEQKLLHQADYFDKLQVPDPNPISDSDSKFTNESKNNTISDQLVSESEQDIVSDLQHPTMLQAFSAIPLESSSPATTAEVLSTSIHNLWAGVTPTFFTYTKTSQYIA